jgi:hypothetical protein
MKNTILYISIILFALCIFPKISFAATPSPTPTSTQQSNGLEQQINLLKDKIASRVAQLKLVDKRGIIGTVTDVTQNQITLNDIKGNTVFVDVDELTKFSSPSAKDSFGISDITKGAKVGVLGLYNKESRRILARFVDVLILPTYVSGAVTDIDSTNFDISVLTATQNTYSIDIENVTKTYAFDGTALAKSGFSKIETAERITVIGFPDVNNPKHIIATRILLFPTLPIDPRITVVKPQALELKGTIVPATGSGVKLTPLNK